MNQKFGVNNTIKDITHSGPVSQKLALHKGATLFVSKPVPPGPPFTIGDLSMGIIKQAAMGSTIVIDFLDPDSVLDQSYLMDKATGAPNGSVARALIDQLNFKRVGDCALLHFFACKKLNKGSVSVLSNDSSVTGGPVALFSSAGLSKCGGEAILEIRAVNVTPGAETVSLFSPEFNAFQPDCLC
jgi:hypothetical protein